MRKRCNEFVSRLSFTSKTPESKGLVTTVSLLRAFANLRVARAEQMTPRRSWYEAELEVPKCQRRRSKRP